jgi:pimeloyl-ACP methyl ester carboxylesterase
VAGCVGHPGEAPLSVSARKTLCSRIVRGATALPQNGSRGPINWYRNGRSAEVTRRLENAAITQLCYFMAGSLDPGLVLLRDAYDNLEQNVPDLRGNVILDGAGHWLPLERTNEVNSALLGFLRGLER